MEIRTVDPRTLREDPENPRRTPSTPQEDATMTASIREIGLLELPTVKKTADDVLLIVFGHRRVRSAIAADMATIEVLVRTKDDGKDNMRAFAENVVRAPLSRVDQWRATEKLLRAGWTEEGIATALAVPVRTIKASRLLGSVHPAMLDQMATGDLPGDPTIRIIALAPAEEQAQVWKKYKPKKGAKADWHGISRALEKRRIPFTAARFGEDLTQTYRIEWLDDLFGPPDRDNRYTTDVEGFFGAQQEWLAANLPKSGILLTLGQYGEPVLPKGAERIYGKPGKNDRTGWYVQPRNGEVESVAYRVPAPKVKAKDGKSEADVPAPRPPLTQKGTAMLGDLRTDALHEAVLTAPIEVEALLGLLVLALSGQNVSVTSASAEMHYSGAARAKIAAALIQDGVLTADLAAITQAARLMLAETLSCRANASQSGVAATMAGLTLGADAYLPNFATPEFLACMSRAEIEDAAQAAKLPVKSKLKDTRASLVAHYAEDRFIPAVAVFRPSPRELERIAGAQTEEFDMIDGDGGDDMPPPSPAIDPEPFPDAEFSDAA